MKCQCRKVKSSKQKTTGNKARVTLTRTVKKVNKITIPQLTELERNINETVIGQEDVVRSICTRIYEGLCFPQLKRNILLIGKSGTGKTEIIRQLSKYLNLPCTIEDATRYTEDGFVGASVTDMMANLIQEADGDISLASRGIVFVDEIDKKAQRDSSQYGEVNKGGVLKGLLKLIEGTEIYISNPNFSFDNLSVPMSVRFDTSNIIFIFGGAFEGLNQIKEKRLKKENKIGFTSAEANHIVINNYMNTSFVKEDLIEYGLPAEFVGRISGIYETRELQITDLIKILDYSKKSEFRKSKI